MRLQARRRALPPPCAPSLRPAVGFSSSLGFSNRLCGVRREKSSEAGLSQALFVLVHLGRQREAPVGGGGRRAGWRSSFLCDGSSATGRSQAREA